VPPRAGSSNEKRQGLRQPKLQISGSASTGTLSTNGLEDGTT
jgi:hypothetical protein